MPMTDYDVIVVGGGVVGCAAARELARYRCRVALVERAEDVCAGTSKANSAIVHAGFDAKPGTAKARFNLLGNRRMEPLARELDFEFIRNGSLVLCLDEADRPKLAALAARGLQNGVPGLRLLTGEEARRLEPNLSARCVAALYAPTGGIVCPFGLTIALAENACDNGVDFHFLTAVTAVARTAEGYRLETSRGPLTARAVVNAAGVYADELHNQVSARRLTITPRKGDYCLLDKSAGGHVQHTIFQLPGKAGKGVLVTPTVHGNLLLGPTATDTPDKENTATTAAELDFLQRKAAEGVDGLPLRAVITSFSGLRAHEAGDDFVLGEPADAPGFFDAAGIESPGLTSAPAIGLWLAEQAAARRRTVGGLEPPPPGHSARGRPAGRRAPRPGCRTAGLRRDRLPVRADQRGGNPRRAAPHPGRKIDGRAQAPGAPGHGALPGRLLHPARDGTAGRGPRRSDGTDLQKRTGLLPDPL